MPSVFLILVRYKNVLTYLLTYYPAMGCRVDVSEHSASADRGTGRLSAAQLGGLVFVDPGEDSEQPIKSVFTALL